MMRKTPLLILLLLLTSCTSPQAAVLLPTTTPVPTALIPTITPTFTPPPTVTPYPTGGAVTMTVEGTAALNTLDGEPQPTTSIAPAAALPSFTAEPISMGQILFTSDFSAGWPTIDEETAAIQITEGRYVFEVGPFDGRFITTTAVNRPDYYAKVDVFPDQCPAKAGYGLLFNYVDASNYYVFTVYCDSRFTVAGRQNGALFGVGVEGAILPGGLTANDSDPHTIAVWVNAGSFRLFFDDTQVAAFSDDRISQGDVAIYATSQGSDVMRAAFDDLTVYELD